jgi:hypothetical protein
MCDDGFSLEHFQERCIWGSKLKYRVESQFLS